MTDPFGPYRNSAYDEIFRKYATLPEAPGEVYTKKMHVRDWELQYGDNIQRIAVRLRRELMFHVTQQLSSDYGYYIKIGKLQNRPGFEQGIEELQQNCIVVPMYRLDASLYTLHKPEVSAKTTLEAGADWIADLILRRILG